MNLFEKIGFHIISIMVATSKKNTISPRQKRILQLLFPLVEAIIEIRKNPIFQNVTLFWLSTDSRAFFLFMESIIEIRRNPVLQKKFLRGKDYSCRWQLIFWPVEAVLFWSFSSWWKPSLKLVEVRKSLS